MKSASQGRLLADAECCRFLDHLKKYQNKNQEVSAFYFLGESVLFAGQVPIAVTSFMTWKDVGQGVRMLEHLSGSYDVEQANSFVVMGLAISWQACTHPAERRAFCHIVSHKGHTIDALK